MKYVYFLFSIDIFVTGNAGSFQVINTNNQTLIWTDLS